MPTGQIKQEEWGRWQEVVARRNRSARTLITLCGPSGAGKTTIARNLHDVASVYLEATAGNPHLPHLLSGRMSEFDARANQLWFLERMHSFVRRADPNHGLVLDQDPAAIVFAYGQMWRESGNISNQGFDELTAKLLDLENSLQSWRSPRITIFLDATPTILHQRVVRRDPSAPVPPAPWFHDVRARFAEIRARLPHVVDLAGTSAEIGQSVRSLLSNPSDVAGQH